MPSIPTPTAGSAHRVMLAVGADSDPEHLAALQALLHGDGRFELTWLQPPADSGATRDVDDAGDPTAPSRSALSIGPPVDRSMRAETVLLRRAVDAASDGVLITEYRDGTQRIIFSNPAFEHITGYAGNEILGRDCTFLQKDDRQQPEIEIIRDAIAQRHGCTVTLRNYRKDGSLFWNRLTLSPITDAGGDAINFVGLITDVSDQRAIELERRRLETHDRLTGLARFDGSQQRLDAWLAEIGERGGRAALLFVDLDAFNGINDTLGFAMGDAGLREVAERLRKCAGENGEVLRYAGDEFLLLVEDVEGDGDLLARANGVCQAIAEPLVVADDVTLYLTASVGVSAYPDCADCVLDLTRQADIAANRAKRNGHGGASVFSKELRDSLADRMALGGRIRSALANGEFVLHYQPQVSARDGTVVGLEALVRWNSPEFGLLMPSRFVQVAEDNGMILQLGSWVLRTACQQLRTWTDLGLVGFIVSVNVSGAQMQRPTFLAELRAAISETRIDPTMLELEITETVLMENAEQSVAQMREIKRMGVRLALDDFGVGYSSLSYLKQLPVNKIKIDRTFITDVAQDGADAALVKSIIAVGHHFGMRVVAEGVETEAQIGYLCRSQCDELQGFHFSCALPADQIPVLVRRRFALPASSTQSQSTQPTLLLLDDEENIRRALVRLLRRDGYRIFAVATAHEAFNLLATESVQVVLSDQRMPGISGSEFLGQVKEMYPATVRMVLSGYTDLATVTDAINRGSIYKFLTKPWNDDDLRAHVQEAFRRQQQLADGEARGANSPASPG